MDANLYTADHTGYITGMLGSIFAGIFLVSLIISIIMIIASWKIFKKAGEPGVAAIVPFWNTAVLFKITWGKWYFMFLMFIPFVNFVIGIMTMLRLAKVFGRGTGFGLGLLFLSPVFMVMLGFGKAQYTGMDGAESSGGAVAQDTGETDAEPEQEDGNEAQQALPMDTEMPVVKAEKKTGRSWSV